MALEELRAKVAMEWAEAERRRTGALEQSAEAEQALEDAREILAGAEADIARLRAAAEALGEVELPGAKPKEGQGAADPPRRRSRPGPPKTSTPAAPTPAARAKRSAAATELAGRVLGHVRANPGCSGTDVAAALGAGQPEVSKVLVRLSREGKIRREKDGRGKANYPAEAEASTADGDGARTGMERSVVEACRASGGSTDEQIAEAAGIQKHVARSIASTLVRRGVLAKSGRHYGIAGTVKTMDEEGAAAALGAGGIG